MWYVQQTLQQQQQPPVFYLQSWLRRSTTLYVKQCEVATASTGRICLNVAVQYDVASDIHFDEQCTLCDYFDRRLTYAFIKYPINLEAQYIRSHYITDPLICSLRFDPNLYLCWWYWTLCHDDVYKAGLYCCYSTIISMKPDSCSVTNEVQSKKLVRMVDWTTTTILIFFRYSLTTTCT